MRWKTDFDGCFSLFVAEATASRLVSDPRQAEPPSSSRSQQFALIQAMRGIAAMWVVLFHAAKGKHIPFLTAALPRPVRMAVFDFGHLGVAIFFALSGFVIAHSLRNTEPSWPALGRFMARRSLRLDPPYWTSMLLPIGLAGISAAIVHKPWAPPGVAAVVAHLLYLQELLHIPEIDVVYWTLTFEIQFYLFFLATMVITATFLPEHRRGVTAWALFYLLAICATVGLFSHVATGLFLVHWNSFLAGALAYRAAETKRARPWFKLLIGAMIVIGVVRADTFAAISAASALLFYWSLRTGFATSGLDWRWLQFLGTISYSLYLIHNPVTGAASFIALRIGLGGTPLLDAAQLVAILLIVIMASTLFWRAIERPSHRLSRRFLLKTKAVDA